MTNEKIIFNLQVVKEIMTDAVYNGIEDEHHFDGAEKYINEIINELIERKNAEHSDKHESKALHIADVSGCFSEKDMEQAFHDGMKFEANGLESFDIDNYR